MTAEDLDLAIQPRCPPLRWQPASRHADAEGVQRRCGAGSVLATRALQGDIERRRSAVGEGEAPTQTEFAPLRPQRQPDLRCRRNPVSSGVTKSQEQPWKRMGGMTASVMFG